MRGEHEFETETLVELPAVVLDDLAQHPALRVPHHQPRAQLLGEAEQVELGAQSAVIPLLRLFHADQVRLQVLVRRPCGAVDPLQLVPLLVPAPIGAGAAEQPDGRYPAGRGQMRAAAQVHEVEVAIDADLPPGRDLAPLDAFDDLGLEGMGGEQGERLFP